MRTGLIRMLLVGVAGVAGNAVLAATTTVNRADAGGAVSSARVVSSGGSAAAGGKPPAASTAPPSAKDLNLGTRGIRGEPALPCDSERPAPGGDWPSYGHDPSNSRTQSAETTLTPAKAGALTPAWTFALSSVNDAGQINSTPLAVDGCVFVTAGNGGVYALDAVTGKLIWRQVFSVTSAGLGGAIVGGAAVHGERVYALINETGNGVIGPHVVALDEHTGRVVWTSKPITAVSGYYSNATPQVIGDVVFAGFSPPEGDPTGQGGFALISAGSGRIVKVTPTITPAHQAQGFAGGGIWSTPAWDPHTGFAYVGAGNPYSKDREDDHANAILKVDLREESETFGEIVAAYKGNVDQYTSTLQTLSHTPVCSATATAPAPLDSPTCGQLDLDFGAAPNLFHANGHTVVGELQKSGVYHVADAGSMQPVWNTIVGATCQACNAASTAFDGSNVIGESTPGGAVFALQHDSGGRTWLTPNGDGVHYQAISTAAGVAYTLDTLGFFDAWDAATGVPLVHRPMAADEQFPTAALTSGGIAIAYHTVYVGASSEASPANPQSGGGWVIAYRAA
jgi:polyvinyl alcohol dehydrogenase (cytochrome)